MKTFDLCDDCVGTGIQLLAPEPTEACPCRCAVGTCGGGSWFSVRPTYRNRAISNGFPLQFGQENVPDLWCVCVSLVRQKTLVVKHMTTFYPYDVVIVFKSHLTDRTFVFWCLVMYEIRRDFRMDTFVWVPSFAFSLSCSSLSMIPSVQHRRLHCKMAVR